jgi:hypothetical protein
MDFGREKIFVDFIDQSVNSDAYLISILDFF